MRRPIGITILVVLVTIGGVIGLVAAVKLIGLGSNAGRGVGDLVVISGVVLLASSLLSLLFAYGAWRLKPWARILGILAQGIWIALSLVRIIGGSSIASGEIVGTIISAVMIYYLLTPAVKRAFGKA